MDMNFDMIYLWHSCTWPGVSLRFRIWRRQMRLKCRNQVRQVDFHIETHILIAMFLF